MLVPRHHERAAEVEGVLARHSVGFVKFTEIRNGQASSAPVNCLLVNTTGELMKFMAMADFVYMGKTMAGNTGGHNIIEPAILGKPIVHGPHMENFRIVTKAFNDASATWPVASPDELESAIRELCRNDLKRSDLGAAGQRVVEQCRGAIPKTLDIVNSLLKKGKNGGA